MKIVITRKAEKDLAKLEKHIQQRIRKAFDNIAIDITTADFKKLRGTNYWRLRVGNYRALLLFPSGQVIIVYRVLHRKDAYK